jgi:hypothetical protein
VFEGVSSLLLHGAVVLTDNRPHDVVDASGKRKLAVTSYVDEDSDELVVDVALGGEGAHVVPLDQSRECLMSVVHMQDIGESTTCSQSTHRAVYDGRPPF